MLLYICSLPPYLLSLPFFLSSFFYSYVSLSGKSRYSKEEKASIEEYI